MSSFQPGLLHELQQYNKCQISAIFPKIYFLKSSRIPGKSAERYKFAIHSMFLRLASLHSALRFPTRGIHLYHLTNPHGIPPSFKAHSYRLLTLLLTAHHNQMVRPYLKVSYLLVAGQGSQLGTDWETSGLLANFHSAQRYYGGHWGRKDLNDLPQHWILTCWSRAHWCHSMTLNYFSACKACSKQTIHKLGQEFMAGEVRVPQVMSKEFCSSIP